MGVYSRLADTTVPSTVVDEGVETAEQLEALRACGADDVTTTLRSAGV